MMKTILQGFIAFLVLTGVSVLLYLLFDRSIIVENIYVILSFIVLVITVFLSSPNNRQFLMFSKNLLLFWGTLFLGFLSFYIYGIFQAYPDILTTIYNRLYSNTVYDYYGISFIVLYGIILFLLAYILHIIKSKMFPGKEIQNTALKSIVALQTTAFFCFAYIARWFYTDTSHCCSVDWWGFADFFYSGYAFFALDVSIIILGVLLFASYQKEKLEKKTIRIIIFMSLFCSIMMKVMLSLLLKP